MSLQKPSLKPRKKEKKSSQNTSPNSFTTIKDTVNQETQVLDTICSMEHYKRGEGSTIALAFSEEKERKDTWGNAISSEGKQKICFKTPLKTVHQVENWKDLNIVEDKESVCNSCRIY